MNIIKLNIDREVYKNFVKLDLVEFKRIGNVNVPMVPVRIIDPVEFEETKWEIVNTGPNETGILHSRVPNDPARAESQLKQLNAIPGLKNPRILQYKVIVEKAELYQWGEIKPSVDQVMQPQFKSNGHGTHCSGRAMSRSFDSPLMSISIGSETKVRYTKTDDDTAEISISTDEITNGCVDMEIAELQAVRQDMKDAANEFDLRCQNIAARFAKIKYESVEDKQFFDQILKLIEKRKLSKISRNDLDYLAARFRDVADRFLKTELKPIS